MATKDKDDDDQLEKLASLLKSFYFDPEKSPLALSQNANELSKECKKRAETAGVDPSIVTVARVKRWLKNQRVAQLYAPVRRRFTRTPFYSPAPNQ